MILVNLFFPYNLYRRIFSSIENHFCLSWLWHGCCCLLLCFVLFISSLPHAPFFRGEPTPPAPVPCGGRSASPWWLLSFGSSSRINKPLWLPCPYGYITLWGAIFKYFAHQFYICVLYEVGLQFSFLIISLSSFDIKWCRHQKWVRYFICFIYSLEQFVWESNFLLLEAFIKFSFKMIHPNLGCEYVLNFVLSKVLFLPGFQIYWKHHCLCYKIFLNHSYEFPLIPGGLHFPSFALYFSM